MARCANQEMNKVDMIIKINFKINNDFLVKYDLIYMQTITLDKFLK